MTTLRVLAYAVYMWFKRRGGFIDLNCEQTVEGTVVRTNGSSPDGDTTFDVEPYYYDTRVLQFGCSWTPTIHCEVTPGHPGLAEAAARLRVGDPVRVTGRWAFDGGHHGHGLVFDALAAIVGWPPNVAEGWTEIHPVTQIEALNHKE